MRTKSNADGRVRMVVWEGRMGRSYGKVVWEGRMGRSYGIRSLEKVVEKVVWEWEWSHGCSRMGEVVLTPSPRRLPTCPWRVRDLEVAKSGQRPRHCEPPNAVGRMDTGCVPVGSLARQF
jgi:hypothetical protein